LGNGFCSHGAGGSRESTQAGQQEWGGPDAGSNSQSQSRSDQGVSGQGADINESDGIFKGTPLTGAAGYSANPEIISELIRLGADIDVRVNNDETALMIAAQFNKNPGIIERLMSHGADINATNAQGRTALDLARAEGNNVAEEALMEIDQKVSEFN